MRQPAQQRHAGQALLDGETPGRIDGIDARRGDGRAVFETGQKYRKPLQCRGIGGLAEDPRDAAGAVCKDFGLGARVDKVGGLNPEFSQDVRSDRDRRRSAQWTVRWMSGRSSENAGMAMENISPCSVCIWYVPTMMPDGVVSGQPLV
jgi:hypothetical protein